MERERGGRERERKEGVFDSGGRRKGEKSQQKKKNGGRRRMIGGREKRGERLSHLKLFRFEKDVIV